ncbi:hypothetical protein Dimus_014113 [Dionaea muscipula]
MGVVVYILSDPLAVFWLGWLMVEVSVHQDMEFLLLSGEWFVSLCAIMAISMLYGSLGALSLFFSGVRVLACAVGVTGSRMCCWYLAWFGVWEPLCGSCPLSLREPLVGGHG